MENKLWRITLDTNPEDCNLNCIMCEEHSLHSTFKDDLFIKTGIKHRRMPMDWLKKIFIQSKALGIEEIIPSTMGEPLLYKGITEIFSLAKAADIKINLTTNGTFPGKSLEDWARIIIPTTIDTKISINGASAKTNDKIMIGSDFAKLLSNVRGFVAYRDMYFMQTGNYSKITFQLTFMQNNMHELSKIVELAASLGINRVKGHHLWTHFKEVDHLAMNNSDESIKKWNQYVEEAYQAQEKYRRPDGSKVILENIIPLTKRSNKNVPENYKCPFLNNELWISATGVISPCCAPDNQRQSLGYFGNIKETSIGEVLNADRYKELVANYKTKEICKTCNMRKP